MTDKDLQGFMSSLKTDSFITSLEIASMGRSQGETIIERLKRMFEESHRQSCETTEETLERHSRYAKQKK